MFNQFNNKHFIILNKKVSYKMLKRYLPGGKDIIKFNTLFNTNMVMSGINKNKNILVPIYNNPLLNRPNSVTIIMCPQKMMKPIIVHESYKSIFLAKSLEAKSTENVVNIF